MKPMIGAGEEVLHMVARFRYLKSCKCTPRAVRSPAMLRLWQTRRITAHAE
jgi:hypothetical protein